METQKTIETLEEMLSSVPLSLIHMSRFSIDEILEIRCWNDKDKVLVYDEIYRKEAEKR